MLIRPQALHTGPVSAMSGLRTLASLHRFELAKPGSSGHDPDFYIGRSKADNGTFGTD
ncbi:hypothetical protein ACTJKN_18295 [Pedobacter sp. 22163]|uniref:hypothetical protein n=1 Tax=Pedobacter sp. 22163 TaxID=3453883 RepID=UPI003F85BB75